MFQVTKIDNGYLLQTFNEIDGPGPVVSYANERALVRGIRAVLGLKPQGRPVVKATAKVDYAEVQES